MTAARTASAATLCVLALAIAAAPLAAHAQASFSAGLVSDYRYRGLSLSGERPAAQLSANYDTSFGAYAGAAVSRARLPYTEAKAVAMLYAGYARRFGEHASWDAGVSETRFRGAEAGKYDYRELYLGMSMERMAARIWLSPRYYGTGGRSAYAEINGSYPLAAQLDLTGHLGYLRPVAAGQTWRYYRPAARLDASIGLGVAADAWTAQLAWTATAGDAALYPGAVSRRARRLVLSGARAF